jgi:hypothetical protein
MKKNRIWMSVLALGLMGTLMQCKNADKVTPDDENELITTVQLEFTPVGGGSVQTFTYSDPDGDGGNAATRFDTISLAANASYILKVKVLDESKTPSDNITEEIEEKADEHLFVFTSDPASLLTYTYGDTDSRKLPIGLTGTAKTGAAGTGKLRVQLRHQPPISGTIVKDGTSGPGSDDVNLNFNLKVK